MGIKVISSIFRFLIVSTHVRCSCSSAALMVVLQVSPSSFICAVHLLAAEVVVELELGGNCEKNKESCEK